MLIIDESLCTFQLSLSFILSEKVWNVVLDFIHFLIQIFLIDNELYLALAFLFFTVTKKNFVEFCCKKSFAEFCCRWKIWLRWFLYKDGYTNSYDGKKVRKLFKLKKICFVISFPCVWYNQVYNCLQNKMKLFFKSYFKVIC